MKSSLAALTQNQQAQMYQLDRKSYDHFSTSPNQRFVQNELVFTSLPAHCCSRSLQKEHFRGFSAENSVF